MRRPDSMIRPFSLALLAVAGLAACQEKLAAPAECPDLCPGNFDVRDTVITPVLGSDSAFEGYLQPGLGGSDSNTVGSRSSSAPTTAGGGVTALWPVAISTNRLCHSWRAASRA